MAASTPDPTPGPAAPGGGPLSSLWRWLGTDPDDRTDLHWNRAKRLAVLVPIFAAVVGAVIALVMFLSDRFSGTDANSPSNSAAPLMIEDVRVSFGADTLGLDVILRGGATGVTLTHVGVHEYVLDQVQACGGTSYFALVLQPTARLVSSQDGTTGLLAPQVEPDTGTVVDVYADETQVGGCSYRSGVKLRPQKPLDPGQVTALDLTIPRTFTIQTSTFVEPDEQIELPAGLERLPEELRNQVNLPGDQRELLADYQAIDPSAFEGYDLLLLVSARTSDGACALFALDMLTPTFDAVDDDVASALEGMLASDDPGATADPTAGLGLRKADLPSFCL